MSRLPQQRKSVGPLFWLHSRRAHGSVRHLAGSVTARESLTQEPLSTRVAEEISDVLLYLVRLADVLDVDLADSARRKLAGAHGRFPADEVFDRAPEKS
jgi:NTP pyrophosphatase (non-canonical NTP hydrolase)